MLLSPPHCPGHRMSAVPGLRSLRLCLLGVGSDPSARKDVVSAMAPT